MNEYQRQLLQSEPAGFYPNLPRARDNHVIKHVHRMHLSVPAAIRRLFFPRASRTAAAQVVARLVKRGYLSRYRFYRNHVYFTLGPVSVSRFGASPRRTKPLGEQSFPVDYATLAYCCLSGGPIHKRLLPEEITKAYPWFPAAHLNAHPYYFHTEGTDGSRCLASIRVELGGTAKYIVRKHAHDVHKYREHAPFRELIERDEFMLVVITTSPRRADAVARLAQEQRWHPPTKTVAIPDLTLLLP